MDDHRRNQIVRILDTKAIVALGIVAAVFAYVHVRNSLVTAVATVALEQNYATEHDIGREMQRQALAQTAEFVTRHLPRVRAFNSRWELLEYGLKHADPNLHGLFCEFGVAGGESINFIAERVSVKVHGFDAFDGLPEDWRTGFPKGSFAVTSLPRVKPNVVLYKGWFSKTLPKFRQTTPAPLAFAHMDADLYSSTRDVFNALSDRLVTGTVIVFDEFFNYPGWQDGERKAFSEFIDETGLTFDYLGYVRGGEQLAVRITGGHPPSRGTSEVHRQAVANSARRLPRRLQ